MCNNVDEHKKQYAEWRKLDTKTTCYMFPFIGTF